MQFFAEIKKPISEDFEEAWMRSQFGETYATYAGQTAALVPYLL
jgi:protein-S-isoprenylcysteine O-methyltransferase Ste14